jgi:hypothetical protein
MNNQIKPSEQEIRDFVSKHRNLGATLADVIGKIAPEVNEIISSGVGWQLIKADMERARDLAYKVLSMAAKDEEKTECKYLLFQRLPRVANMIDTWLKAVELIRKDDGTRTDK